MDASATYCSMPFETHVSINVDICFPLAFFAIFFLSRSRLFQRDLSTNATYAITKFAKWMWFQPFGETSTSLDVIWCCMKIKWTQPDSIHSSLHHILLSSFIVIRTSSVMICTRQTCSEAIIIKNTCDMQRLHVSRMLIRRRPHSHRIFRHSHKTAHCLRFLWIQKNILFVPFVLRTLFGSL